MLSSPKPSLALSKFYQQAELQQRDPPHTTTHYFYQTSPPRYPFPAFPSELVLVPSFWCLQDSKYVDDQLV